MNEKPDKLYICRIQSWKEPDLIHLRVYILYTNLVVLSNSEHIKILIKEIIK